MCFDKQITTSGPQMSGTELLDSGGWHGHGGGGTPWIFENVLGICLNGEEEKVFLGAGIAGYRRWKSESTGPV